MTLLLGAGRIGKTSVLKVALNELPSCEDVQVLALLLRCKKRITSAS